MVSLQLRSGGFTIADVYAEKAQLQVCEAGLSKKLADIVSGPRLLRCQPSLGIIIQLFEQLVSQGILSFWERLPMTALNGCRSRIQGCQPFYACTSPEPSYQPDK